MRLRLRSGPPRFDGRRNPPARPEITLDHCPHRIAGLDQVIQHLVHHVFLENSKVSVAEQILFPRLQLSAAMARHIAQCAPNSLPSHAKNNEDMATTDAPVPSKRHLATASPWFTCGISRVQWFKLSASGRNSLRVRLGRRRRVLPAGSQGMRGPGKNKAVGCETWNGKLPGHAGASRHQARQE